LVSLLFFFVAILIAWFELFALSLFSARHVILDSVSSTLTREGHNVRFFLLLYNIKVEDQGFFQLKEGLRACAGIHPAVTTSALERIPSGLSYHQTYILNDLHKIQRFEIIRHDVLDLTFLP
jgi:hypothetical protein